MEDFFAFNKKLVKNGKNFIEAPKTVETEYTNEVHVGVIQVLFLSNFHFFLIRVAAANSIAMDDDDANENRK